MRNETSPALSPTPGTRADPAPRRRRWAAELLPVLVFLTAGVFYVYTLQPSLAWGDGIRMQREVASGESFIFTDLVQKEFAPDPFPFARLGVAAWDHPLYVILGHSLVRSLPEINPLWLTNLLSALFGAATVGVVFQLCLGHTRSPLAALAASGSLAVSHTFWFHAATPEVYCLLAFLLLSGLQLFDNFEKSGRRVSLIGSGLAIGLAASNHLLAALTLPTAVIYFARQRRAAQGWTLPAGWLRIWGMAFLAGFLPYLIQFARMLRTFPIDQVMGPAVGSVFLQSLLDGQPAMLAKSVLTYAGFLGLQFGPLGLAAGIHGFRHGGAVSPGLLRKAWAFFVVYAIFGIFYRVTDQFAFFLPSYLFWALAIGMGVARWEVTVKPNTRRMLVGAVVLSVLGLPVAYRALPGFARSMGMGDEALGIPKVGVGVRDGLAYYIDPNKREDLAADAFGRGTLAALPINALVISEWYTDTDEYLVLRYFTGIEGLRPDVEILGWPLEDPNTFEPRLVVHEVRSQLPHRPVFLASLSDRFYAASELLDRYCIVPEANLYRVYPDRESAGQTCLTAADP